MRPNENAYEWMQYEEDKPWNREPGCFNKLRSKWRSKYPIHAIFEYANNEDSFYLCEISADNFSEFDEIWEAFETGLTLDSVDDRGYSLRDYVAENPELRQALEAEFVSFERQKERKELDEVVGKGKAKSRSTRI